MRVAVLMGGRSSERDVSLASGRSVCAGLAEAGHEPIPIEIGKDGRWELGALTQVESNAATPLRGAREPSDATGHDAIPADAVAAPAPIVGYELPEQVDVVFPALHGPFGEDGTVQGLLDILDVPYVGSGVAASAIAMDKSLFKDIMKANGIPTTESVTFRERDDVKNPFGFPVVVKPARLGSSVGITIAADVDEFDLAVALAFTHDDKILVERYVSGREVECSVLGNDDPIASVPGEIVVLGEGWYDYEAKYSDGGMRLVAPADVGPDVAERVRELSLRAFHACDCAGMARVDCFVDEDDVVLVNELNTIPGFTQTSVYSRLFEASGVDYPTLLSRLVEHALERYERRSRLEH
jgi:D-alanine-D-alanine ligase